MNNAAEWNDQLQKILNYLKTNEMNSELYQKIAEEFSCFINCPSNQILEMISYFLRYRGKSLYVNEIRNYLKIHSEKLFIEYGNKFKTSPGCFEVFGINSESIIIPSFKENIEQEPPKEKEYSDSSKRKKRNNSVKREARKASAEKFKKNIQRRREKESKRDEIEKLIRKQDL